MPNIRQNEKRLGMNSCMIIMNKKVIKDNEQKSNFGLYSIFIASIVLATLTVTYALLTNYAK